MPDQTVKSTSIYFSPATLIMETAISPLNAKIFIIEDDLFSQSLYCHELENHGYLFVNCFESGADLIDNLAEQPELIFLDYNLGDYDALTLLPIIKEKCPDAFIVIISSQTDITTTVKLMNNGVFDYLVKEDFNPNSFASILDKWIQARELSDSGTDGSAQGMYSKPSFLRMVSEAQQNVRKSISEELHDNVNQLLVASKIYMDVASKDESKRVEMINESKLIIDSAIKEVRKLSHLLNTKSSEENQLSKDLMLLLDGLKMQNNFNLTTNISELEIRENVSREVQHDIFRIIQELMNNVIKYSAAKNVNLTLELKNNRVELTLTDDGVGFDAATVTYGLGLRNIRNRLIKNNAEYSVDSSEGNGCRWKVTMATN